MKRLKSLFAKLASMKGLVFIVATVLLCLGINITYEWIILSTLVIGGRTFEKFMTNKKLGD